MSISEQSETIVGRLKAMTEKTAEITARHHDELAAKNREISELKEQLRQQGLELIKAGCNISKADTLRKSAELELENYKRKSYYFASKLIKLRQGNINV